MTKTKPPLVLALYNRPRDKIPFGAATPHPFGELRDALEAAGYRFSSANIADDPDRVGHAVTVFRPTLVFNLVDQIEGNCALQGAIAGLLELYGYVATGGDSLTLVSCQDRVRTKLALAAAGIPVAGYHVIHPFDDTETIEFSWPVIATLPFSDIYRDYDQLVAIDDRAALRQSLASLGTTNSAVLVEQYRRGRSLQCVVFGNTTLHAQPITETSPSNPEETSLATLGEYEQEQIRATAKGAFVATGCRDVAQIDLVLPEDGVARVVAVRPMVDYFCDGPFRVSANAREAGFAGALTNIVRIAHARVPASPIPAQFVHEEG